MKKIISLLLSLTMLLSIVSVVDFSAYADTLTTGKCGKNVTYSFDAETGVLTISGEGDMENYNYENNPFYKKSNIKTVIIKNGVTSIGDWVFYNCSSLTSITIPNSVTSIGNWVFRDCTSLTSVAIPTSVTSIGDGVFYCCESLTSIEVSNNNENYSSTDGVLFNKNKSELITYPAGKTDSEYAIPNSVTSIGSYAFFDCESLTSVTIPNSVTNIGVYAFYGCKSLTSVTIPDSVISIGDYAFSYCESLTSVTIPNSVTSICSDAFSDCTSLKSIEVSDNNKNYSSVDGVLFNKDKTELIKYPSSKTDNTYEIPDSVTSIGAYAFQDCSRLTSVTIPNSVTSIGYGAFLGCSSLTSVTIPDSVISIGDYAFSYCESLTSVTIPNSVTGIGSNAFYKTAYYNDESNWDKGVLYLSNCLIDTNDNFKSTTDYIIKDGTRIIAGEAFRGRTSLTNVTIPNSVTSIGYSAFLGCSSLTSVTIPNSVTNIGDYAFSGCESLTSVTIPDSVTIIGSVAFSDCTSLTSVTIPDSVTSIGSAAFEGCSSLTSVTIPRSVTSIGDWAFSGCYFTSENFVNNSNVELDDSSKPTIVDTDDKGFCIKDNELVRMRPTYAIGEVTIPNSIASIGRAAFYNCESLTSVTIPNSVTSIGSYAFYDCTNLANVYYSGSQSDWNKITIGDYNECLTNAALHCSSTPTPTPEPTPTPNPAPQPPTQPTQETQQATQQTAQQQSVKNDTATEQVNVAKPKSTNTKKIKAAKKAISVEWKKVSGVKGYQIQVATDKKFKKNKKTVTIKKQKTTKTTVKKLKAKKKYYVRVRTYKIVNGKKVYSSWSKVKSVKTK